MNIQQFYQQSATASLNASLVAFIPAIAILIYAFFISQFYQLILLVLPFLIYSFICFQKYQIHHNRAMKVNLVAKENSSDSSIFEKKILFGFMPAPSLRLLFFTPNGTKAGEMRDDSFLLIRWFLPAFIDRLFHKKYVLFDRLEQPIAFFYDGKDRITIMSPENQEIAIVYKSKHGKKKEFICENYTVTISNSSIQDYSFILNNNKTSIADIQTGWMPLDWAERFVDSNTPVLTVKEELTDHEMLQLYSLLITLYKYGNH